jgi:hypothetical protein
VLIIIAGFMNKKSSLVKGVLIFGFILGLQLASRAAIYVAKFSADGTNVHTLRGAIAAAASNHVKNDTIYLTQDSYQVTAQMNNDELAIAGGDLTIVGHGRSRVTISAASLAHVFHVLPGAQLTLKNLTITGGGNNNNTSIGGAVFNEGTLKLINCDVLGNGNFSAGGIYNSGSLTMNNSVVANNSCISEFGDGGNGGGIYNAGTLTANNCVISNNFSGTGQDQNIFGVGGPGGAGGNGGGIYNVATMILNNCYVMDNFTGSGGKGRDGGPFGGQPNDGGTGGSGGGIYNAGSLMLKRCIIGGNFCGNGGFGSDSLGLKSIGVGGDGGNGGAGGSGGEIFNTESSDVKSYNSLIILNEFGVGGNGGVGFPANPSYDTAGEDGNSGADGLGPDLFGDFISTGYNLVREGDDSTGFTNGVSHDIVGTIAVPANPQLYKFK